MTTHSLQKTPPYTEEGRPWYDTKSGIENAIKTLSGFKNLIRERHNAYYERKENLNELYVLGDYLFDVCGNIGVAERSNKRRLRNIPDVMSKDEFWNFLKANEPCEEYRWQNFAFRSRFWFPSENHICPICKKGWEIGHVSKNITNLSVHEDSDNYDLENFVGKTLKDVKDFYYNLDMAQFYIGGEPFLNNDCFIDLSPWTDNPETELEKSMVKNDNGWVGTKDGIDDNYVIQKGDIIHLHFTTYYHKLCYQKKLGDESFAFFKEIFEKAGFKKPEFVAIPNEYDSYEHYAPWYVVTTEIGNFKIGWRKRVINIEWKNMNDSIISLFDDEDVTKGKDYIHAWGEEAAIDYLSRIYQFFQK